MEGKLEINRLDKTELQRELAIRGVINKVQVKDMRKCLSNYRRLEKTGMSLTYPDHPYTFEEDKKYLDDKIAEIKDIINNFADCSSSTLFLKTTTKLIHTFDMSDRMKADTNEEKIEKSKYLVEITNLQSELKSRAKKFKKQSLLGATPLEISALFSSTNVANSSDSDTSESDTDINNLPNSSNIASTPQQAHSFNYTPNRTVPVAKWNINKFSGENSKISLNAFLENIEDLCLSRNVSKDELLNAGSDLFMGKALIWFRSIRDQVHSWPDLVQELKTEFHPPNFNEKLFQEIKNRTQGPNETIGIYLAVMSSLFGRLTVPVSENVKLKILLRNISPFYQNQLGLVNISSVSELLKLGRQLETRKEAIESFIPPPSNKNSLMEPDLAYVYTDSIPSTSGANIDTILTCWNCHMTGHKSNSCKANVKNKHCYKCGTPNHTVRSCPKCNLRRSGNERERR